MKLVVGGQTIEVHGNHTVLIDEQLDVHINHHEQARGQKRKNVKRKLDFDNYASEETSDGELGDDTTNTSARLRRKIDSSSSEETCTNEYDGKITSVIDIVTVPQFRVFRSMWMVEHGDGTANWLYSPADTKGWFTDGKNPVWAFSNYVVAEQDYNRSVRATRPPPLCTHYVTTCSKNGDIECIEPLPYNYFQYAVQRNSYFQPLLDDIFRNCLNRGQTQATFDALKREVKQKTALVPRTADQTPVKCTVCNAPNHSASAQFGPFYAGSVCSSYITHAIQANTAALAATNKLQDPEAFKKTRDILHSALHYST